MEGDGAFRSKYMRNFCTTNNKQVVSLFPKPRQEMDKKTHGVDAAQLHLFGLGLELAALLVGQARLLLARDVARKAAALVLAPVLREGVVVAVAVEETLADASAPQEHAVVRVAVLVGG